MIERQSAAVPLDAHVTPINSESGSRAIGSDVFPKRPTLSATLWGLDFGAMLPRNVSAALQAVPGELARIRDFLSSRFPSLTEEALSGAPNTSTRDAKLRYLNACDLIELRDQDRTVGAIVGAPEDWSTYYVRIFAIAEECQHRGIIRKLVRECLFQPLAMYGVQRIAAETSPANRAMCRLFSELEFHATGHQLSDRWGALVRYTRFLDRSCEAVFLGQFSGTAPARSIGSK
jgi:ribosomal protein S18 acetylase RimI-like enzyme